MSKIVVIGGGGHAKVLVGVLKKLGYRTVGYTDLKNGGTILGAPYLGNDDVLQKLAHEKLQSHAVIGVGKVDMSELRVRLASEVRVLGFELPVIVSPHAVVNEEVELSPGTVVFDGVVVNSGTTAGELCILNTNSTVEHDCRLGDNVHVGPGATISGGVTIGPNCMIGAGSTVSHGVTICADCMIGAGSTVVRDITTRGTYAGNPARKL